MLRSLQIFKKHPCGSIAFFRKLTFLTKEYRCNEAWKAQTLFDEINLNDFYNNIDQNYSTKGIISAVDVDIFANAIKDSTHLEELRDLLHKLRLSAETGSMLDSTHQATIRNYIEFGNVQELINILKDPLNFGVFLDEYMANILLDKLISSSEIEQAANVASLVMLQEDYSNPITTAMCQYACYKYVIGYCKPAEPEVIEDKKKKVEEIKIRIKFLRNHYDDSHFDIKDVYTLAGKTLVWMSDDSPDDVNVNLQLLGWFAYQKFDELLSFVEKVAQKSTFQLYDEVKEYLKKEVKNVSEQRKLIIQKCLDLLSVSEPANGSLEDAIKIKIENAINKSQKTDVQKQQQLFLSWAELRKQKLLEQTKRLDRAKRIEIIDQKQKALAKEEQKLWFFENEDSIDLQIEEKEKSVTKSTEKKASSKIDEDYIPPEILPKRR